MNKFTEALYSLTITLWVGALFAIGYLAAPTLFTQLTDRTLAGSLAGEMCLAGHRLWRLSAAVSAGPARLRRVQVVSVLAGAADAGLDRAGYFGIQPILAQLKADALPRQVMESALRDRFATWHGISSILYLIESLLGVALVLVQERGKRS